ncbi:MAG: type IV toxin-antitoxin system AbiEi family antitoxin [Candidatus Sumerlaeota bacterium]|nr:type IV toxin-antitoxin system AbiEi family antitoxin [Candidatus Sumerlaeota bacterium]
MLKRLENLKERELKPQFEAALRNLLKRAPLLKIESLRADARLARGMNERPDWQAKLRAGARRWTLVLEGVRISQPREVRTKLLQIQRYLSLLPPGAAVYGILLAPYLSKESARLCTEAGIGYVDMAGNARLSFDQIFIETRSAENPFREQRAVRSIFSPKATRVLRVLLQGPLRPWKVTDLALTAQVSLGHVSAVRQRLLAQEWAEEQAGGLRITKPDAVLDAWAAADRFEDRTTAREYSLLITDPAKIAARTHALLGEIRHAFTQWFAASLRHPYTEAPVTTVYVEEFPNEARLEKSLLARRVVSGGRLRLVAPKDEGVFHLPQKAHGLPLVCDVQIYLDLLRAGLRGDEAAAELRKWPDFSGGWA